MFWAYLVLLPLLAAEAPVWVEGYRSLDDCMAVATRRNAPGFMGQKDWMLVTTEAKRKGFVFACVRVVPST